MIFRKLFLGFSGLLLAACASVTAQPEVPLSTWGNVLTLGQAEQRDAPSLWANGEGITAAWIGADETGIHQDIRAAGAGGLSDKVVLPLPPYNPYDQHMLPAGDGRVHLLWLDTAEAQPNLYTAIITPDLTVDRGPTRVTDAAIRRYTALANDDGSAWAAVSGGDLYEPILYIRYIDNEGRPRLEDVTIIARDADYPTLARTDDGRVFLYWIGLSDGQVFRAELTDGIASDIQPLTSSVPLNPGDRLNSLDTGLDTTHGYLFWNITRADGTHETWLASGRIDEASWEAPRRLGVETSAICQPTCEATPTIQTGFNTGVTFAAVEGNSWAAWGAPLAGQSDTLPMAAQVGDKIVALYLQSGMVRGYWEIIPGQLIGQPGLYADRDGYLYLTWAQPNPSGTSDLQLASIKLSAWGTP